MLTKDFYLAQVRRGADLEAEYNREFIYQRLEGIYGKKPTTERFKRYLAAVRGKPIAKPLRSFYCFVVQTEQVHRILTEGR